MNRTFESMNTRETILQTPRGAFAIRDSAGPSPALLLVHGTGHNLEVWTPVVEQLRGEFRAVSFDLRGHGQTPLASADPEDHWRDLAAVVETLGLERPLLVGHSGGGYAATAHVAAGSSCCGLILVDGFVPDTRDAALRASGVLARDELRRLFRYGWIATDAEKEAWIAQVAAEASGDWLNAGIDASLVEAFTRRSFVRHGDGWLRRPTLEEVDTLTRLDGEKAILPARDVYGKIGIPTAFVFASRGLYRDRRDEILALTRAMNARFVELESGHNVHMVRAAEVASVIRDLARREAVASTMVRWAREPG